MTPLRFFLASVIAPALLTHQLLFAQQVEPPPSESEEDSRPAPQATVVEEIVVSAHLEEARRDTVGSSVTVIESDEIGAREKVPVLELLRRVPGLEAVQGGGPGKVASVLMRGGSSSHTLVLIDGVRVNNATTGSFDFADLKADNIERIEVLRGPQSSLYGSEAVGGVISIMTKRGLKGLHLTARAEAGSDRFRHFKLSMEGGIQKLDYSLSVADLETEGVSAASESAGNSEPDAYDNLAFSGRVGWSFAGNGRADLTVRYTEGDTELDGFTFGIGPTDDLNALQEREFLQTSAKVEKPLTRRWKQTFVLGATEDDLRGRDEDTVFSNFDITSRLAEFRSLSDISLTKTDTLTLGYSVEKRRGEVRGAFDEAVYLHSVFLENRWSWQERLHLSVGLRNDDHSSFGTETTFRLTGSYLLPSTRSRLHASVGSGFKAPTLNDLYFPGFGNTELAPETSRGFDLGFEQDLLRRKLGFDVTYFDNEFENLIIFDPVVSRPENLAQGRAKGLEVTLKLSPSQDLELVASHTYTDSEDSATGRPLPRRPEHRSTLDLLLHGARRLSGMLSVIVVRNRIDFDLGEMDDYERVDLTLGYGWTRSLRPYLRIENLLDQDYEEIPGFTTPGFTAALGLRMGV
jgi:vitamin B12 transporter